MVSGLMQSEGEGERSRLVTGACSPSARPAPAPNAPPPRCAPPSPSPGMPFSDRNSSRSTYCNTRTGQARAPHARALTRVRAGTLAQRHSLRSRHFAQHSKLTHIYHNQINQSRIKDDTNAQIASKRAGGGKSDSIT